MYNISSGNETTTRLPATSTALPRIDELEPVDNQNVTYLIVPFVSLFIIGILTIAVILLIKRKRRIDRLRHHLMPFYNFAPGEEEDWETELLESETETQTRRVYPKGSKVTPCDGSPGLYREEYYIPVNWTAPITCSS